MIEVIKFSIFFIRLCVLCLWASVNDDDAARTLNRPKKQNIQTQTKQKKKKKSTQINRMRNDKIPICSTTFGYQNYKFMVFLEFRFCVFFFVGELIK